ncbi:MAG TPA: glycosyltransferase family 4 protein [Acidimicrobiia bacterium]|nr:glycosyltransferase family 4 protein [Acidimicrobiia bacterium]
MSDYRKTAKDAKEKVVSSLTSLSSMSPLSTISTMARKKKNTQPAVSTRKEGDPMRVALMCPYSISIPGGVQNQVLLLAAEMRSRGIDARIIAPCDGVPPTPYVMSVGTTRGLKSNGSLAPIVDDAASASLTLDAINSFGPDVIHLHEPLVPGPTTTAMIGAECAIVATFHSAGQSANTLKYIRHPARGAISRVHKRVAVSNEAKATVDQYLPGDYTIIPNCIDVTKITQAEKWPTTKPAVLFVGRHEERKGLRYLIEAWLASDVLQRDADLWIAGLGEETEELVARSKEADSISFLGRIEYEELFRRMRAAHIVVAPALHGESFGIVLLEAMAANACVVASSIPGYRDVARDGIEALLVPPGDSAALGKAIESILADDSLRRRLQAGGIARSQEFSVTIVVDSYVDIYKSAMLHC